MTARAKRPDVQQSAPAVSAVTERVDGAHRFTVGDVEVLVRSPSASAADLAQRLHAAASVPPAPPRDTPWGDGQFDHVELAPGLRAALRITEDGDVVLLIPGGELTVTSGGTTLGLGLLEAGRRASEVRGKLIDRARRCKHEPRCKRCDLPLFGDRASCPRVPWVCCIPRDQDVRRRTGGGR